MQLLGAFGHRDNTYERGRGDPGDEIFRRLAAAGAERLDFGSGEDLEVWRARQARLVELGEQVAIDGEAGPATIRAMRRRGFAAGRELDL